MWMDDSNVSNCMSCNNTFSLMLRKVYYSKPISEFFKLLSPLLSITVEYV